MSSAATNLRARNMQKRRVRILAEARNLITSAGFESLNIRDLARLADVTVPTIYNLIGKKEDVLLALGAGVVTEIEARVVPREDAEPLTLAGAVVIQSTELFREDESFYRSAFLAVEWLDQGGQHHEAVAGIYAWAGSMMRDGIDACRNAQLIRGRISPELMSELITRNYRMNCRGWALGHYDLATFRRMALSDLYITLSADAVETFQLQLLHKITDLGSGVDRPLTTRNAKEKIRGDAQ